MYEHFMNLCMGKITQYSFLNTTAYISKERLMTGFSCKDIRANLYTLSTCYMFALFEGRAGKDTMWYHKGEEKPLKPRRCPMPVPILCLGAELCHFVER